ncbi:hypothetical protein [Nisaea sp.]|uniref:hypothetical protein n=1 Tax=Nisaea sp. TaxID=2024842 RepID=UPI0032993C9E
MNPHNTRIMEALNTRSALPTAAVTSTVNAAIGNGGFSTDRVRYRLKGLQRRGYVRYTTGTGPCPRFSWTLTDAGKAVLIGGEPKKVKPIRRYEVVRQTGAGEFSLYYTAHTRNSAIYMAMLEWREINPDITFLAFRKGCRAFLSPVTPRNLPTGCYSYVKQRYGVVVDAGDRIQACGRSGIVVPHTQYHHVHFVPDGLTHSVPVHPSDVTVLERRAGA